MKDLIGYDKIIENSMRGVISQILKKIEKSGLIGDHYFVISFSTNYKGVSIPKSLKDKFPEEMTIVIQYQFNYLIVKEDEFIVSLSFSGKFEELTIPYKSITSFADPSINFGLKFNHYADELEEPESDIKTSKDSKKSKTKKFDSSAKVVSLADFRDNKNLDD